MANKFIITVQDILSFHKIDRIVFDQVKTYGRNPSIARNIVALWLWLELVGINVVLYINGCNYDDTLVQHFIYEAETILRVLRPDSPPLPMISKNTMVPFTASLVNEPLSLEFFYFNSDRVVRGISYIMDGVGRVIFDENLNALMNEHDAGVRQAERGEMSSWPVIPSELERGYEYGPVVSSEVCRSLFITFSKGCALTKEEIFEYFTKKWGACIDMVTIEETTRAALPMYGRVAFTSEFFVKFILNGVKLVKLMIKGKHLWAREYSAKMNPRLQCEEAKL